MTWTTPRTWVAGETVTAAIMNTHIRDNLNAAFPLGSVDSAWSTYVPALTATTTNPTLGASPIQLGQYTQVGKLIVGDAYIQFGASGAAPGNGAYFISLPVAAALPSPQTAFEIGSFSLSCAGLATRGFALLQAGSVVNLRYTSAAINGTLTTVTNAAPGVFTNSDNIRVHFAYMAA